MCIVSLNRLAVSINFPTGVLCWSVLKIVVLRYGKCFLHLIHIGSGWHIYTWYGAVIERLPGHNILLCYGSSISSGTSWMQDLIEKECSNRRSRLCTYVSSIISLSSVLRASIGHPSMRCLLLFCINRWLWAMAFSSRLSTLEIGGCWYTLKSRKLWSWWYTNKQV